MTYRTLIGTFASGDYRMRRSKPGYDVTAALEPERLAFDSAWPDAGIIYTKGTVSVPLGTPNGYVQVNFADTLPAVPNVIYYWKVNGSNFRMGSDKSTNVSVYMPYFTTATTTYVRFWQDASYNPTAYTAGYIVLRPVT